MFHSKVGWESEIGLVGWRVGECYECVLDSGDRVLLVVCVLILLGCLLWCSLKGSEWLVMLQVRIGLVVWWSLRSSRVVVKQRNRRKAAIRREAASSRKTSYHKTFDVTKLHITKTLYQ